jgi:hypothetical protein
MNYKLARVAGIKSPIDGYTLEERVLEKLLTESTIRSLYAKLPTFRMKAIVALHFELGYPQELVADMMGVAQPSLVDEIALIQQVLLGKIYRPRKNSVERKQEEAFKKFVEHLLTPINE